MSIAKMSKISIVGLKSDLIDIVSLLSNYGALQINDSVKLNEQFLGFASNDLSSHKEISDLKYYSEIETELSGVDYIKNNSLSANLDIANIANWNQYGPRSTENGAEDVKRYFFDRMYNFALADARAINGKQLDYDIKESVTNSQLNDFLPKSELEPLSILLANYIKLLDELIPKAKENVELKANLFTIKKEVASADYIEVAYNQEKFVNEAIDLFRSIDKLESHRHKIRDIEEDISDLRDEDNSLDELLIDTNKKLNNIEFLNEVASELLEKDFSQPSNILPINIDKLKNLDNDRAEIAQKLLDYKNDIEELSTEIENIKLKIIEQSKVYEELEILHDFYEIQYNKIKAMKKFQYSEYLFGFNAYIATALVSEFSKELKDKYNIAIEVVATETDEDYPVLLQNNRVVRPIQSAIDMYALPRQGYDVDPSFWTSIFYYLLFGMMLGDVGYGALLAIACAIGLFVYKAEGNTKRTLQTLMYSGIVAIPFGFMFGSFFGNMLTTVSDGAINFPTLLFNPLEKPIEMLILSMGIGLLHLYVGMGIDIYIKTKRGAWKEGFFGVAPWYLIVTGIILVAVGQEWAIWLPIVGVVILLLLGDQSTKNPFKRVFSGLSSLVGITNWLSDLLSYSRILALSLSTSVIAMVINILAMLIGFKGLSIIPFSIIMVFGHILDLALSALSCYVHTTRLQYVEFFGKFYEGGGNDFMPLDYSSKYTRVEEVEKRQEKIKNGEFKHIGPEFKPVKS